MTFEEWQALLKRLRNNDPTLTRLTLSCLGDDNVQELCAALRYNSTLRVLALVGKPGDAGEKSAGVMKGILIGNVGAKALCEMLSHNRSLQILDLEHNNIERVALKRLIDEFEKSPTLTKINLRNNHYQSLPSAVQKIINDITQRKAQKPATQNESNESSASSSNSLLPTIPETLHGEVANTTPAPLPGLSQRSPLPPKSAKALSLQDTQKPGPNVFYDKFIGVDDQVEQISQFFNMVKKKPQQEQRLILLSGPPGTGKTELAKKVSAECGFEFIEFVRGHPDDQYVGQLEKRVIAFFQEAKNRNKYVCLCMDEMDAICPETEGAAKAGHHNQDQIVSTIQMQISGLVGSKVVLLGATNYLQKLKGAIRSRAGTPVVFKLPTLEVRLAIFNHYLSMTKLKDGLELEDTSVITRLAEATTSWSPRQIALYLESVKSKAEQAIDKGRNSKTILTADFLSTFEGAREVFKQDYKKECPNTTIEPPSLLLKDKEDIFAELVGLEDDVKLLLQGICEFVKDPAFFRSKGTDVNRNAIFWGPPGTGKTERARLIAQNTNALFINIDAGKYKSSATQEELRQIFILAKNFEKTVVFIDEMDAITHEGSWARELLQTELDGFIKGKDNVLVVIGATNYLDHIAAPVKSRFAAQIEVALPTLEARAKLFNLYLSKIKNILFAGILQDNFAAACQSLAEVSEGLAPRDIKLLVDMAVTKLADIEKIKKIKQPLTTDNFKIAIADKRKELGLNQPQLNDAVLASSTSSVSTTYFISAKALKLDLNAKLGVGNYGIVFKATWNTQTVAVKNLFTGDDLVGTKRELQHEAKMMAGLQHQNIVKFFGVCTEDDRCMLVMEYVHKGSLYGLLHSKETLDWPVRIQIAVSMGSGLEYLHRKSIIHRDLSSMNVLVSDSYEAKLTDFGLAKLKLAVSQSAKSNAKGAGTLLWMAPELFMPEGKHSFKSDVYSTGVIMWELSTRKIPFMNAASPHIASMWVSQGMREKIPDSTPAKLAALISKCWHQRVEDRPTAAEAVQELQTLINK